MSFLTLPSRFLKPALRYDDALDTFGVHAIGGTLGAILTGILATKEVNANLKDELLASLFVSQLKAVALTLVVATVATAVIAFVIKLVDWPASFARGRECRPGYFRTRRRGVYLAMTALMSQQQT